MKRLGSQTGLTKLRQTLNRLCISTAAGQCFINISDVSIHVTRSDVSQNIRTFGHKKMLQIIQFLFIVFFLFACLSVLYDSLLKH